MPRSRSRSPARRRRRSRSRSKERVDEFGRSTRRGSRSNPEERYERRRRSRSPEERYARDRRGGDAERLAPARRARPAPETQVFVGNLSYETTAESLRAAMEQWGHVTDCRVPVDRGTGQPRGFAFVTFRDVSGAAAAAEAGTMHVDGREARMRPVSDKDARPKRPETSTVQAVRHVWGKPEEDDADRAAIEAREAAPDAAKPDFGLSGALAKDEKTGNVFKGHVLRFTEPDDAVPPRDKWRIYVFKDDAVAETLHIHRQSAFLVGRIKDICDVLTMHPSCSGQHAVIQFRARKLPGDTKVKVLPYIMDLESTNGTKLNKQTVEPARYYEIQHKDLINFGQSSRDYVFVNTALEQRPHD